MASAFEVLGRHPVDLIVSDTDLPDLNGMSFFRKLVQERRLRDIPGVRSAAYAMYVPQGQDNWGQNVFVEGRPVESRTHRPSVLDR